MSQVAPSQSRMMLYDPTTSQLAENCRMQVYSDWIANKTEQKFGSYDDLWRWSVDNPAQFWLSIAEFFEVNITGTFSRDDIPVSMPGGEWFPGATLNYAAQALKRDDDGDAIVYRCENGSESKLSFAELNRDVALFSAALKSLGVVSGDRVAAYLPNIPEAVVGFLACARIGAVWSLCSPDLGSKIVVDRFRQISPKVLIASNNYEYGGKFFDRTEVINEIAAAIGTLNQIVHVGSQPLLSASPSTVVYDWISLLADSVPELANEPVDFNHPLWVVYTSGTTGLPKPIVHSHGGVMLELCKLLGLHMDLGDQDRFFWYSSTGWIMWNLQVSGLLVGATIALYDGNPAYPEESVLWRYVSEKHLTYFGAGAPLFQASQKDELKPSLHYDFTALRAIGSTGSPLPEATFEWISSELGGNIPIDSVCGGTDVATGILGPCRLLPLYAGELQCRCLGSKIAAFDTEARPVVGQLGELVIEQPMPSMPIYFWGDEDGARYRSAYFEKFEGVWSQGDWVRFSSSGSCVVFGRSDATLNRGGIRLGTGDFYNAIESLDWVADSLVVDTSELGKEGELILFIKTNKAGRLEQGGLKEINQLLTKALSPRHRPDKVIELQDIPRTLTGKKLEVPVKKIINGAQVEAVANLDAVVFSQELYTIESIFRELG